MRGKWNFVIGENSPGCANLRHWFAGKALQRILANPKSYEALVEKNLDRKSAAALIAEYAFAAADVMLTEGKKNPVSV